MNMKISNRLPQQLTLFKDKLLMECQVYDPVGELIFCGTFEEVLPKFGNTYLRNVDIRSNKIIISLS